MGAAGAGKTTIGRALGGELGWPFLDGDDRHSEGSIRKMQAGIALTDADRLPWLMSLHQTIARMLERREHLVLACSAPRAGYRELLRGDYPRVRFVYLKASEGELVRRLAARRSHFAGPALVASQLATLEEPAAGEALTVDATWPTERIVAAIRYQYGV